MTILLKGGIMNKLVNLTGFLVVGLISYSSQAAAFSVGFEWGNIPSCRSGNPKTVSSPNFRVSDVPPGAVKMTFRLRDNNAPDYNHGGGSVTYKGGGSIAPGAFKYKSPCPPSGVHTYVWTATAFDKTGKKLGSAKASKRYP
jgi:phosphatidylethanolamine-binding protein (PEBP) family uncharacterized protein